MGSGGQRKKHYQFDIKDDVTTEDLADIIQNMFPQGGASEYFYKTIKERTRKHLREMTEEEVELLPDMLK